jgi:hypothetical protein
VLQALLLRHRVVPAYDPAASPATRPATAAETLQ